MKFREDIKEGYAVRARWLGWGKVLRGKDVVGTYFFIQLPVYKMVHDLVRNRMAMGKLTLAQICRKRGDFWENEQYRVDWWIVA